MKFVIDLGIVILNGLYFILKCFPVKNKIVYISRQMDTVPVDFRLIEKKMSEKYPHYSHVILAKTIQPGLRNKAIYSVHILRQMYHLATAKVAIIDTYCIAVSVLKQRKSLTVIQIWHALGALKKFGYSILDKGEGSSHKIAYQMKMHHNYSYVFCSSEYCRPFFSQAFNQPIEKVKVFPLPKVDLILDQAFRDGIREKIFKEYPELKMKPVIVYAPTFRKKNNQFEKGAKELIDAIDYDKYNLVVKLHPIEKISLENSKAVQDKRFTTFEMFCVADYIISDYSAVIFEAMLLHKPLFLYAFDYKKYNIDREFYVDYEKTFASFIYESADELIAAINSVNYDDEIAGKILDKMVKHHTKKSYTEDICDFIDEHVAK